MTPLLPRKRGHPPLHWIWSAGPFNGVLPLGGSPGGSVFRRLQTGSIPANAPILGLVFEEENRVVLINRLWEPIRMGPIIDFFPVSWMSHWDLEL